MLLLLIDPPRAGLLEGGSNALLSLADWVERRAHDAQVRVLDWANMPLESVNAAAHSVLASVNVGRIVVGITTMTATYQSALCVARAFKSAGHSGLQVCLGGHHATPEADVILQNHRDVDLIVRGEGEHSLLDIVNGLPYEAIPGVSFRTKDFGLVTSTEDPVPLTTQELDSIDINFDRLASESGKFGCTTIVTARGCPLGCRFCVVAQSQVRARSVAAVTADLTSLIERGFTKFSIEDNFFAQSPRRTLELCRALSELQRNVGRFSFDCQTRVESCSDSIVSALAEAGCNRVFLGVEALAPRQLHFLGKTLFPEQFMDRLREKVLPSLFRRGIEVGMNLQAAIPQTTEQEKDETFFRLEELAAIARREMGHFKVFTHLHVIYSGTPEFRDGVVSGAYGRDIFEHFTAWEAQQPSMLRWLGQHFAHGAGGLPIALLNPPQLAQNLFEIEEAGIKEVDSYLRTIASIHGVNLFDYAPELTGAEV